MAEALKNAYDPAYMERLAEMVSAAARTTGAGPFDATAFRNAVFAEGWESLELKARMGRIGACLFEGLPRDYRTTLGVLCEAAASFDGYLSMYFPELVGLHGLEDWDASVEALHWMTRFGSSEFAVRPFLKRDAARMLATMLEWTQDSNEHVRRLASEGCRPRLPWAMALPAFKQDPTPLLPILERLRGDPSEYVRRSVANNLNDISKDHPRFVYEIATRWLGESTPIDRLVKHACRTLLKSGEAKTMRLFGFKDPRKIAVLDLRLSPPTVELGGDLTFHFRLASSAALGKIRLEYVLDYARPSGRSSRKVFKISESDNKTSARKVTRRQSFADLSTRTHHAGTHRLSILVNGCPKAATAFELVLPSPADRAPRR